MRQNATLLPIRRTPRAHVDGEVMRKVFKLLQQVFAASSDRWGHDGVMGILLLLRGSDASASSKTCGQGVLLV